MKDLIMSLKPYWYYLICEYIKVIECRKAKPMDISWSGKVHCYMSKDKRSFNRIPKEFQEKYKAHLGKVGMRFVSDEIKIITNTFDETLQKQTCLSGSEMRSYANGRDIYGWHISDLKIYDKPKELKEFRKPCVDKYQYCQGCRYGSVIIPPDEEEYALYHGGYYDNIDTVCHNYVTRPPQSWGYVEELE